MSSVGCAVVAFMLGGFATVGAAQPATIINQSGSAAEQSVPATQESVTGETPAGFVARMKFDVSNSSQGTFLQLVPAVGYRAKTWGVGFGVPLASSRASSTATGSTSHSGVGDVYLSVYYAIDSDRTSFTSTVLGTAPTGNSTIGLGTGQGTWNWTNHVDRGFGRLTPFLDAGVGNGINSATSLGMSLGGKRAGRQLRAITVPTEPYTTIGKLAHWDVGIDLDVSGAVGFSVSVYDTVPWGDQTAISRFVPLTPPAQSGHRAQVSRSTKGQRFFEVNAVTQGTASLTRDNGFGASVAINPMPSLDLVVSYSHSVPMKLDVVSVSVSTSLTSLFRETLR